jgi:hypothetical protein
VTARRGRTEPASPWRALAGFHAGAGARAALRSGTIGVALVLFAFGSSPTPAYTLMQVVLGIVGRPAAGPGARMALAAAVVALAALGAGRVTLGARGWPASLPVPRATARRAAWAAAGVAALPAVGFAVAAVALAPTLYDAALDPARVAGLPLPRHGGRRRRSPRRAPAARVLGGLALAGAVWGTWSTVLVGHAALVGWDRLAGGLAAPAHRRRAAPRIGRRASAGSAAGGALRTRLVAYAVVARWTWRALGWRAGGNALLAAALPIGFCALVRANNPDLAATSAAQVARLGAGLGVALAVGTLAGRLLAGRAPWAWARALPWSAAGRVAGDAAALGIPVLAVVGGVGVVLLGAVTVGATVATTLVAAVAASGALRAGAGRQTGAAGEAVVVGVAWAVAVALWPLVAAAAPLVAAALGALAVRRERRSPGAVRWNELRHDPAGDALWLTRP